MVFLTQYQGAFLGPIAKVLGVILNGIYNFLSNFGIENAALCIVIFTFIVNALMIPLTIKQQKYSKLSSVMAPELSKIQSKYKGKKDEESMRKFQLEQQALYQRYGASPTAGCLPLLISMPILFALYRVIYAIPAYVNQIGTLYENIATALQGQTGYISYMTQCIQDLHVATNKWPDITNAIPINHLVDILSQFRGTNWEALVSQFPNIADVITTNSQQIMHINSFFGVMNISELPGFGFPGILIPILAAGTQILQTKLMPTPEMSESGGTTAATMKSMNTFMPIMSGVMCFMFPIGVGLYWVANSVFRIIQQICINKYLDRISVEKLIEKNVEKAKKKKLKLGMDPEKMEEYAKQRTSTIRDKADTTNVKTNLKKNKEPSDYKKSEVSYKAGSISANAHLLNRNNGKKEEH